MQHSGIDASRIGWLHLARPRENWHRLGADEQAHLRREFGRIRRETAADGVAVFGPYDTEGYEEWSCFVYAEFADAASLFRFEERLQAIDYMNFVDFENHLGRTYSDATDTRAGRQPYGVVGFARHDDAWYSHSRAERDRIEEEELVPSVAALADLGVTFLGLNICDVTAGPRQFFLWEAPSLEAVRDSRAIWNAVWRRHRGLRMLVGKKVEE